MWRFDVESFIVVMNMSSLDIVAHYLCQEAHVLL